MSQNGMVRDEGVQSNMIQKFEKAIDLLVRIAIIGVVILVEWGLLGKLTEEEGPISIGLLAAIVIIVGLLVLSMTAFRGSVEEDVKKLQEDLETLHGDLEKLKAKIEK